MKSFKKKMLLAFLIAMTANTSYSSSAKKNSKDDNEFIILGTYQKLENTFTKNDIKKHSSHIEPLNPINPVNPVNPDNTGGDTPGPTPNPTPEPLVPMIDVVKESGTVVARKFFYGENLTHNVSGDITSNDEEALWMIDKNTVVVNDKTVESNYTATNVNFDQQSVHVDDYARFINNGTIGGINATGVYLNDHSSFENTASGIINNASDFGVRALNNSSAVNDGHIQNVGDHGMAAFSGSSVENGASGVIENTGSIGMITEDNGSSVINRGTIKNGGAYGIWVSQATGENYGIIENNAAYGMIAHNNGKINNYGDIKNNGNYGMWAQDGSTAVNQAEGTIQNTGNHGMNVLGTGTVLTTAINDGLIANTGEQGMSSTGVNGSIINNGTIKNLSKVGMQVSAGATALNTGLIENTGSRGIFAETGASAINEGIIKSSGASGMRAESGGYAENKENGLIANNSSTGIYVTGLGSLGENRGTITNNGMYGMWIEKESVGKNYGVIQNKGADGMIATESAVAQNYGIIKNIGDYGMWAQASGRIENYGTVQNIGNNGMMTNGASLITNNGLIINTKDTGMSVQTGGTAVNGVDGIIRNGGNIGMAAATSATATNYGLIENGGDNGMLGTNYSNRLVNNGTIKNKGNVAMTTNGGAVNNGLIELTGDNKTGMSITSGAQSNNKGVGINNGTILIHGANTIGMSVADGGTIINQGTITLDGTGTGMSAVRGSHIILGTGSIINIGSQTMTATGSETTADGFYITADGTSDVNNQGAIASNGKITIDGTGKFILNSATGSLQATRLVLNNNLYVGTEDTLNSSADQFVMNNLNIGEITGDGGILPNSPLFTLALETTDDNDNAIIMKRKSFTETVNGELGVILEKNYKNSENNERQNKVYNSLKSVTNENTLLTAEKELTGDSLVNNQTYQLYNQDKIISNGIDKLMDRRTEGVDNGIYVNFLASKTSGKTETEYSRYDAKSAGVVLGGMKKVGDSTSVGGFLGYLNTNADYTDNDNKQNLQTWSLTGAVNKELTDELVWKNRVNYNYGMNESEREITFDNSNRTVKGDFNSWSAGATTELEYSKKLNDIVTLRPTAGIAIDYLSQEGYTEKGADELNLKVDSKNSTSTRIGTGIRADVTAYKGKNSALIVTPRADYSYELGNPYGDRNVQISAFEDSVVLGEREAGKNYLNAGLDVEYKTNEKFSLYGGYDMDVLSENTGYNVVVGFKYKF